MVCTYRAIIFLAVFIIVARAVLTLNIGTLSTTINNQPSALSTRSPILAVDGIRSRERPRGARVTRALCCGTIPSQSRFPICLRSATTLSDTVIRTLSPGAGFAVGTRAC